MLEAVRISHDFPLAGVRMFGNGLALRMCPVTERSCVSFGLALLQSKNHPQKGNLGRNERKRF